MTRRDSLALWDYLSHMLQAIERIDLYVGEIDQAEFTSNPEKQDAVIRNLEILDEAAGSVLRYFPDFAAAHPELPFRAAYATRNALAHGYFAVDLNIVWKTIERDLPLLEVELRQLPIP